MILPAHHLRGHVSGCSTRVLIVFLFPLTTHTQISDSEVSLRIKDQILGLDIAVDDAVAMQILKAYYQIGNEEFGLSLCELSPSADVIPACLESYLRSPPLT